MTTTPNFDPTTAAAAATTPACGVDCGCLPNHAVDGGATAGVVAVPVIPVTPADDPRTAALARADMTDLTDLADRFGLGLGEALAECLDNFTDDPTVMAAARAAQARYNLDSPVAGLARVAEDWLGVHGTGV